jgi:citrate lyase subunit beta/citryl-CoA lyase
VQRAHELPADALILDLEDAVAPAAKHEARATVCKALANGAYAGRPVAVRVNAIGTEWHEEDIAAAARSGASAIVVPKVAGAADIEAVERSLELSGAPGELGIWAMIETPLGVLSASEIAAAGHRLSTLVVGVNDLESELRAQPATDRAPLLASLSLCVLAARAHGRRVLDGVYNDIRDLAGFEAECRQGRALGFDGKTVIHPSQIESCNRAFYPTDAELERARRVIEAYERAAAAGHGVALLDGQIVEHLHVRGARELLATAGLKH